MSTPKQIAANQQNAQLSTGPKTAHGKAIAKMNAFKQGILARRAVLKGRYNKKAGASSSSCTATIGSISRRSDRSRKCWSNAS